jgi:hypothetical protein
MVFLYLLGEILLLSFLSRFVSQKLYILFYLVFRSKSMALSLMMAIFFPGTVIHELSHLFTAEILGVHTGKLTLVPEPLQGEEIRAGSVEIAQTGVFRRTVIGIAPLLVGIGILSLFSDFFVKGLLKLSSFIVFPPTQETALFFGALYLLFTISNTMIPSPTDLKGTWITGVILLVALLTLWYTGLLAFIPTSSLSFLFQITWMIALSLQTIVVINIVFLMLITVLSFGIKKATHTRLIV